MTTCLRQHLRHVTKGADSASNLNLPESRRWRLDAVDAAAWESMCLVSDHGVRATQACMRTLLTNSVNEYSAFLKACTASQVDVVDCSTVTNDSKFRRPPLFAVDLAVEDSEFTYSSKLESFVNVPLERFDDLMRQTQAITRVERVVMRNLFWSFEPVMKSVHPSEDWVLTRREK